MATLLPYIFLGAGGASLLFFRKRNQWKSVPKPDFVPFPDGDDALPYGPADMPKYLNQDVTKNQPRISSYYGRQTWFQ